VNSLKRSFWRSVKAVSPVIATIIIVAIAIVMSIAVAYWMLGLGSSFTKFEKVEFTSAWAEKKSSPDEYVIHMTLKNTGSATATFETASIMYNGKPDTAYADGPVVDLDTTVIGDQATVTLDPGQSTSGLITLPIVTDGDWSSSMSVEVQLQSTAGRQYPKVIVLP
jgi:FlaG/FlaF family flagellin (archaellin)